MKAITRECPDCGHLYVDTAPRLPHTCSRCEAVTPPRRGADKELKLARKDNPKSECVCCAAPGKKIFVVEGVRFLLCDICNEFGQSFQTRELFFSYRESGGGGTWLAAGYQTLFAGLSATGVSDLKETVVPRLKTLRQKPGSFRGGVPYGYNADGSVNDSHRVVLNTIQLYLARNMSLNAICKRLVVGKCLNKHGKVSWSPSQISFLARREGWI